MMDRCFQSKVLVLLAAFCLAASFETTSPAADDVRRFVEGLRERRYFDTASEYLDSLASDEFVSAGVRQLLPYEQGIVLIESASSLRSAEVRDQRYAAAQAKLRDFITSSPSHEMAELAQQQLAGVLRFRADQMAQQAKASGESAGPLLTEAGALYDEARGMYSEAASRLRSAIDSLPKNSQTDQREQLGMEWLGARLNSASVTFDLALTRASADEKKKLLTEAASQCNELYVKFPQRMAGVAARFYEGRCYQELSDHKRALAAYGDLIADLSEADPKDRSLKTKAFHHALECWLETKDFSTAAEKAVPWAKSARGAELRDPQWLEVKLGAAEALIKLAGSPGAAGDTAKQYLAEAAELASDVAKSNHPELSKRGRMMLAQHTRPEKPAAQTVAFEAPQVKTFDEAYGKAEEATDEMKTSQLELEFVKKQSPPDQKEIEQLETAIKRQQELSFEMLKRAIELADVGTDPTKLQTAYYLLSFFHYQRGNYLEAALIGEHLARKFPESTSAQPAARVALASFDAAFRAGLQAGEDVTFEADHLAEIADFVSQRWPDQPAADAAFDALLSLFINQGEYEKAAKTLERIKPDSPSRAESEAKLGQALWAKYLRGMQELRQQQAGDAEGAEEPRAATAADLDKLMAEARQALERGIDSIRKQKDVNPRMVLAALSLAQIYVHNSEAQKALDLLQDPKLGPVTLLSANHPSASQPGIAAEIHKTAMRAYVGVEPQQIDKATASMEALEKIYAGDPKGESKFTMLLVSMAAEMQQQIEELGRTGQDAKQAQLVAAFEQFLRKIPERKAGTDYKTLIWVANTYQGLAKGLASGGGKTAKQAQDYYRRAADSYSQMLQRDRAQAGFIPEGLHLAVKQELAKANRGAGDYDQAIKRFSEILKEKATILPIQEEAAMTYQTRADGGSSDDYVRAIRGGGAGDTASIWGWAKLANQTARNPQFQSNFHRARYNLSLCRRRYANSRDDAEKTKQLQTAKNEIRVTMKFEPTMGGDEWRPKYDRLLKDIQQALGEQPVGLKEFEDQTAAAK